MAGSFAEKLIGLRSTIIDGTSPLFFKTKIAFSPLSLLQDIIVVRFLPSQDNSERMGYMDMYKYLSSRKRCGVVGNNTKHVKDMYLIPLPAESPPPKILLPFDGPGERNL
jgi:hypothetical protein